MLKGANFASCLGYCSVRKLHLTIKYKEELEVPLLCQLSLLREQKPQPKLDTLANRRDGWRMQEILRHKAFGISIAPNILLEYNGAVGQRQRWAK